MELILILIKKQNNGVDGLLLCRSCGILKANYHTQTTNFDFRFCCRKFFNPHFASGCFQAYFDR